MSSPGGVTVARASVRILPDTSVFGRSLGRYLDKAERTLRVEIPTIADTTGLTEDVEKFKRRQEQAPPVKLPATLGDPVDSAYRNRLQGELRKLTSQLDLNIPATVQGEQLRRSLAEKIKEAEKGLRAEIPTDPEEAVKYRRKLREQIDQVSAIVKAQIPVEPELDQAKVNAEFDAMVRKFNGKSVKLDVDVDKSATSQFSRLASVVGELGSGFARVATTAASVGGALPIIAALGSTLAATAGAAAILPGALTAVGAAALTVKAAMSGIGDAINAEDAKELAAAMEKLPPPAREFVTAARKIKDEFAGVTKAVQSAFFSGLGPLLRDLGTTYLPVVRDGMVGIARSINDVIKSVGRMLKESSNVGSVRTIFDSTKTAVSNLGAAVAPVIQALLDIASVGSEVFAELTGGAGSAAQRFADFIREAKQSGRLREYMQSGIDAIKSIGAVLSDVAAIASGVFKPLIQGAGSLNAPLSEVLDTVRELVQSSGFQDFAQTVGEMLRMLADALGGVLSAALANVLPLVQDLAAMLRDHMAKVLPIVVPLIQRLADFLGGLLAAVLPLLQPVMTLVQTLLPPLAELFHRILGALEPLLPKIQETAAQLGGALMQAIETVKPSFERLATTLGDVFEAMAPVLGVFLDFVGTTVPLLIQAAAWVADKLLWLINVAITPLVDAWSALSSFAAAAWAEIKNTVSTQVNQVKGAIDGLREVPGKVGAWFNQAKDEAGRKLSELVDTVRGIPGRVVAALGNLANVLYGAGGDLVSGFIRGMTARIGEAASTAAQMANAALAAAKSALGIASPSKVFRRIGGWTAEGFAQGIDRGVPLAVRASRNLAESVMFSPPALGSSSAGSAAVGGVQLTQHIYPRAEQSETSIGMAAARYTQFELSRFVGPA